MDRVGQIWEIFNQVYLVHESSSPCLAGQSRFTIHSVACVSSFDNPCATMGESESTPWDVHPDHQFRRIL